MHAQPRTLGYILKRYPRLSETFILNEIRALERLGVGLHIFSLLPPDPAPLHPALKEVRAPVTYLPERWREKIPAVVGAHAAMARVAPWRYLRATGLALWWSRRVWRVFSVWKQFLRAGYIADQCRRCDIRYLHAHFANAPAAVAELVSVMLGIPYSFTTHAKDLYLTPKRVLRHRVAAAAFIATCTRYNRDYLRGFLPEQDQDKVHLIYHGIDLCAFDSRPDQVRAGNSPALILSVGRLVPKKGMADLIAACGVLHGRGIEFRCEIVGAGPLRGALQAEIERRGLQGIVTLRGAMAHDRLIELYRRADVFALSPHVTEDGDRDGIPNVLAEAMAAGVPVVTTSVSGIPELIEDGRTGLLVEPRNPAALADALQRLLRDPALGRTLTAAARRRLEQEFDCWETARALRALFPGDEAPCVAVPQAEVSDIV
ncbi:MAG: glycosyltransferase [Gammaproteobacteria bacterium]|nr:glycosyltransferase [Gammaproteobacteria bacterium]